MKLKDRARALREQTDARAAEATAKWDELVTAKTALGAVESGRDHRDGRVQDGAGGEGRL